MQQVNDIQIGCGCLCHTVGLVGAFSFCNCCKWRPSQAWKDPKSLSFVYDDSRLTNVEAQLKEQLNKLAEFSIELNKIRSECKELLKQAQRKIPHKCPVCEGEGTRHGLYNNSSAHCEACEGKGIIWG